jgi:hypothetical protein
MTVKAINTPQYEYTCDLCGKQDKDSWLPPNWEGMSIALYSGEMAQLHVCQTCLMHNMIVVLVNKIKTGHEILELTDFPSESENDF